METDTVILKYYQYDSSRRKSTRKKVEINLGSKEDYIKIVELQQLVNYFLPRGWVVRVIGRERVFHSFEKDNLRVYFNVKQNQWRLKNTNCYNQYSLASMLDLKEIKFPFNRENQLEISKLCSENHGITPF